jgi:hypothetical protein
MAGISSGYFRIIQFVISIVIVNIIVTAQIRNLGKG